MKKSIILIIITTILLSFSACSNSSGSNNRQAGFSLDSFKGGDQALTYQFADNAPPEIIRDGGKQPFSVRIDINNVGETTIPQGEAHVALAGIQAENFGLTELSQTLPELRGISKQGDNEIPGGRHTVIFNNLKYNSEIQGTLTQDLFAYICYPYQTRTVAVMCVSGAALSAYSSNADNAICQLDSELEYANSGAPVKIENIKQIPQDDTKILLQFDIVHTPTENRGLVFEPQSTDSDCKIDNNIFSSADAALKKNVVTYTIDTGITGLNCEDTGTNTNKVQLDSQGRYTVFCVQDTTNQDEYQKPITINIDYDYFERIGTQFEVQHFG